MLEIKRAGKIDAEVRLPGSKSYTNRALLVAAMARGQSVLRGALFSDDTLYMARALKDLGLKVSERPTEDEFVVQGEGGKIPARQANLFIGNAGTAMRFLTAFLTLGKGPYKIDGIPRMRKRPIGPLVEALKHLGAKIEYAEAEGFPPLIVERGGLAGGRVKMAGDVSSQFFSAILMTAPYAGSDVAIEVEGNLVSAPYVDMTLSLMSRFGVEAENDCFKRFSVKAGGRYGAIKYTVEPDASSATYFLAAAAITGGRVRILGLDRTSKQGDVDFVDVLGQMGCSIESGSGWLEVKGARLRGIDVDMNKMPDAAVALAAVAAFADGKTCIRNVANLRLKETDRLSALANELSKAGCRVKELEDGLEIEPGPLHGAVFETYNDHRMAMSLALLGLRLPGIKIKNPQCVAKTFPDYFQRLEALSLPGGRPPPTG